jgi:hypothetical protein
MERNKEKLDLTPKRADTGALFLFIGKALGGCASKTPLN